MCWPPLQQSAQRNFPSLAKQAHMPCPASQRNGKAAFHLLPQCPRTLSADCRFCSWALGLKSDSNLSCQSQCHVCWSGATTRTQSPLLARGSHSYWRNDRWLQVGPLDQDLNTDNCLCKYQPKERAK